MREDIAVFPAEKIKLGANRKKIKTGLGQSSAPFSGQHRLKTSFDFVLVQNIARRVLQLLIAELSRAPIG